MVTVPHDYKFMFHPLRHARLWLILAVSFFGLALYADHYNELSQYRIYLSFAVIFLVAGILPFFMQMIHSKSE